MACVGSRFSNEESAMHLKHSGREHGPPEVSVTLILEDPMGLTGKAIPKYTLMGGTGESILELAMEHGINIEHACGGVCACSTCHVYVESGMDALAEATEAEDDRVEEAPGLQKNSRLSCQCVIEKNKPMVVRIPSWNRNAVKEVPH
jgi:2Fe-2S ferredoxin